MLNGGGNEVIVGVDNEEKIALAAGDASISRARFSAVFLLDVVDQEAPLGDPPGDEGLRVVSGSVIHDHPLEVLVRLRQ